VGLGHPATTRQLPGAGIGIPPRDAPPARAAGVAAISAQAKSVPCSTTSGRYECCDSSDAIDWKDVPSVGKRTTCWPAPCWAQAMLIVFQRIRQDTAVDGQMVRDHQQSWRSGATHPTQLRPLTRRPVFNRDRASTTAVIGQHVDGGAGTRGLSTDPASGTL